MQHFKWIASTTTLLTALPVAGALLFAPLQGCILDESFLKQENLYPCEENADCSEPGYVCNKSGFCAFPGGTEPCVDEDGDGFGSNDDRRDCVEAQQDKDDTCALCTPITKEVCDGVDNDTNGETDELIPCQQFLDCPGNSADDVPTNLPSGARWTCQNNLCVVVPPKTLSDECKDLTIACVDGAYDTTAAMANGCF